MDFYTIKSKVTKGGTVEIWPDFSVGYFRDLMIRGRAFYAIWDEERQIWSTDERDVQRLVDSELTAVKNRLVGEHDTNVYVRWMRDLSSGSWMQYRKLVQNSTDIYEQLDDRPIFANTQITRSDHASRKLPYPLEAGDYSAWDELISTLYLPEEKEKLEWAIGSVVAGEAKNIQKFYVLYGGSGKGKSTVLNIIQKLFEGYYAPIESKSLGSGNNSFATEMFRSNPIVAIEHEGDLSKIEDNTKLNSIVGHEEMMVNEKFKSAYRLKPSAAIFIGTNKPVKITDAKSGIIRRLVLIEPSGNTIPSDRYWQLMAQIEFQLGGIAHHCLDVFRAKGKNYYDGYVPRSMILQTNVFFNYVDENYYTFLEVQYLTLQRAWDLYRSYCDENLIEYKMPKYKFRDELKNYFGLFEERVHVREKSGDTTLRNVYSQFKKDMFISQKNANDAPKPISFESESSIFDIEGSELPAQLANDDGLPRQRWANVTTTLADINTKELHYVKLPSTHIVIDFDLTDDSGEKSQERNLLEATKWPATYGEFSKSGKGVHLHYIYDGDPDRLQRVYSPGIEIKVFNGDASLRRKLTKCNTLPIAHINAGLPLKGEKMINTEVVKTENGIRKLIARHLNKEIMAYTAPSIGLIKKILDESYSSGIRYDVTDMRPKILDFAMKSTHQADNCLKLVTEMKFKSEEKEDKESVELPPDSRIVFYDVEVFPNLFLISWKYEGVENKCVRMYNPKPEEVEGLFQYKLIGFNNRRYDNHILYGAYLGYTTSELFTLSNRIINNSPNAYFREAYNLSYADIYDFSSKKQSLKAFQLELGIRHKELGLPWNQPVPEELWDQVGDYCDNDVISTEATFEDRKQDFIARQILAELSGLSVNDTTQMHTARIIFGNDPRPQDKFNYVDLSKDFPGYKFDNGKSTYRGEETGEGGYVYAEPGMYENVALLDVASMHPSSIINMNMFGPYTKRYEELLDVRLSIKHKDYEKARTLLNGMMSKYLDNPEDADALAYALKIHALNIVYGLTSASFENKFKDPRNIDNIVAKRGALFMIDLKHAVQEKGFTVAHIKTDSIKIPNATQEIIDFVFEFGKRYGYTFEHEATYSKFCLVNNAVYIAKYKDGKKAGKWTAVGAEFDHPYVYKTLFSKEDIVFSDLCETKAVTSPSALYLDMNESLGATDEYEKELSERTRNLSDPTKTRKLNPKFNFMSDDDLRSLIGKGHNYQFVGKVGSFCPVVPGAGGGLLVREKNGKYFAASRTKGYRWLEAEVVKALDMQDKIDTSYHEELVANAIEHISTFGDFNKFVSD